MRQIDGDTFVSHEHTCDWSQVASSARRVHVRSSHLLLFHSHSVSFSQPSCVEYSHTRSRHDHVVPFCVMERTDVQRWSASQTLFDVYVHRRSRHADVADSHSQSLAVSASQARSEVYRHLRWRHCG